MARIHEVLIVPAYGACGADGWNPGATWAMMHEVDIIDGYVQALREELELRRIRHSVMATRDNPGYEIEKRPALVGPNSLVLHCCLGWEERTDPKPNWSHVRFGGEASINLAQVLTYALGTWGRCYVYGHETRNPTRDTLEPLLNVAGSPGVEIRPFAINGPDRIEYATRLRTLGRDIAWAIEEYLGESCLTGKAAGGLTAPPKPPARVQIDAGIPAWVLDPEQTPAGLEYPSYEVKHGKDEEEDEDERDDSDET